MTRASPLGWRTRPGGATVRGGGHWPAAPFPSRTWGSGHVRPHVHIAVSCRHHARRVGTEPFRKRCLLTTCCRLPTVPCCFPPPRPCGPMSSVRCKAGGTSPGSKVTLLLLAGPTSRGERGEGMSGGVNVGHDGAVKMGAPLVRTPGKRSSRQDPTGCPGHRRGAPGSVQSS